MIYRTGCFLVALRRQKKRGPNGPLEIDTCSAPGRIFDCWPGISALLDQARGGLKVQGRQRFREVFELWHAGDKEAAGRSLI